MTFNDLQVPYNFTDNGIDITVSSIFYDANKNWLEANVAATKNGQPVNLDDGIFQYSPPPTKVPDGTFRQVAVEMPDNTITYFDVPNMKEDIEEAFKMMISQTVRNKCRH